MGQACASCHASKDVAVDTASQPLMSRHTPSFGADNMLMQQWLAPGMPAVAPTSIAATSDVSASAVRAELANLVPQDKAPEPGAGLREFGTPRAGSFNLSPNRAFTRRTAATLIGKVGFEETRSAADVVDAIGELKKEPQTRALSRLMTEVIDELKAAWDKFSADVRNAGIARLKINHKALGEWRPYVEAMAPQSLRNQSMAAQEMGFMQGLADKADPETLQGPYIGPHSVKALAERRAVSTSPGEQLFVDDLIGGHIHGGCQECHSSKAIGDFDRSIAAYDPRRVSRVDRMLQAAESEFWIGPSPTPRILDKPVQGARVSDKLWSYVQGQPGLSSIAQSADSIAPKIMPLVNQYHVVPEDVLRKGLAAEQLLLVVLNLIDVRRAGYLWLQDEMSSEDYDFLQMLPVVDAFIPMVDADVRLMVRGSQQRSEAARRARGDALAVGGIIAFLLTIFPPTAILGIALGAVVAAGGVMQGYADWKQGLEFYSGTGAGVFSAEQEAAAQAMMASGMMSMALNAFALVLTPLSLAKGVGGAARGATPGTSLAKPLAAAPEVNAVWTIRRANPVSGEYTIVGQNVAKGGAGEVVTVQINVKTGMGTATMHGPDGMTVPIVNGRMQFSAGMLPQGAGAGTGTAMVHVPNAGAAPGAGGAGSTLPPGTMVLPAGEGPSLIRGYLPAGDATTTAARPHLGSRIVLQSDAPALGEAPVFGMGFGPRGQGGVRLMNRGMRPSDLGNSGARGPMMADDALHLDLWTQAEARAANSPRMNAYRRWQAAVQDGSVSNWTSPQLDEAFAVVRGHYMKMANARGLDVATIHHWNWNKNLYPEQIVDPRNLVPVYGKNLMRGTYHPGHQGGLHRLMTSGRRPTNDPIASIHELSFYNYDVPAPNPQFPGMPEGWHPPMVLPE